ncbi:hypothetical protein BKA82DRAFT_748158 [Pisolithus tinctorius]|uniref:Uncharacterized protein n=1 Tax=Pisolithus tinctorius Marx 270 TaxID=870435 RepID=A0A0C3PE30_PISTI|nr:hypothetical protein BKA82DRAFT_748158 [Pisolithus tinctorius]KIO12055.1 hypothetical protein M404DRAFT_748158 [Pisolithus tinctorius Marx 270]
MKRYHRTSSMLVLVGLAGLKDVRSVGSRRHVLTSHSPKRSSSVPARSVSVPEAHSGACTERSMLSAPLMTKKRHTESLAASTSLTVSWLIRASSDVPILVYGG